MPRFKRKNALGLAILFLLFSISLNHLFYGQLMRVKSELLMPIIGINDVVFVDYSRGEPGNIVVVDTGELQVLRRLVGLAGDEVQIHAGGIFRNGRRLKVAGIKPLWGPIQPSRKTKGPKRKSKPMTEEGIAVPEGFAFVTCDVPRLCTKSSIDGLVPLEQVAGHVVYHQTTPWTTRETSGAASSVEDKK